MKAFNDFSTVSRRCLAIKLEAQLKKCSAKTAVLSGDVGMR